VLDACLEAHPDDREAAFRAYQDMRKANTDALCDLVKQNFNELRDTANQPAFVARKKMDLWLSRLFPGRWMPLYSMVVHTTMPYAEALARHRRQERILSVLGVNALLGVAVPAVLALRRAARRMAAPPVSPPRLQVAAADASAPSAQP
jgi:kynurenine 3-monooxygenase